MKEMILLFDGVCNFCNFWVNFVLDRDKKRVIRFAPLQSDAGRELLRKGGFSETDFDTFILTDGETFYTKSDAGFKVATLLGFPYSMLRVFALLPRSIRNAVYGLIAKNRYRFFGKKEVCRIPTPVERERFLS